MDGLRIADESHPGPVAFLKGGWYRTNTPTSSQLCEIEVQIPETDENGDPIGLSIDGERGTWAKSEIDLARTLALNVARKIDATILYTPALETSITSVPSGITYRVYRCQATK